MMVMSEAFWIFGRSCGTFVLFSIAPMCLVKRLLVQNLYVRMSRASPNFETSRTSAAPHRHQRSESWRNKLSTVHSRSQQVNWKLDVVEQSWCRDADAA